MEGLLAMACAGCERWRGQVLVCTQPATALPVSRPCSNSIPPGACAVAGRRMDGAPRVPLLIRLGPRTAERIKYCVGWDRSLPEAPRPPAATRSPSGPTSVAGHMLAALTVVSTGAAKYTPARLHMASAEACDAVAAVRVAELRTCVSVGAEAQPLAPQPLVPASRASQLVECASPPAPARLDEV